MVAAQGLTLSFLTGPPPTEEGPLGQEAFFEWALFLERRLSYRQLALVDLGAIPRSLTRTSPLPSPGGNAAREWQNQTPA